jgi:hypothetical protein
MTILGGKPPKNMNCQTPKSEQNSLATVKLRQYREADSQPQKRDRDQTCACLDRKWRLWGFVDWILGAVGYLSAEIYAC